MQGKAGNVSKLEGIVEKEKVTLMEGECLDTEIYSAEEDQKVEEGQEQEKGMHTQQKDKCLRNEQEQETLQSKICQFGVEEADGRGQGHECEERKQTVDDKSDVGESPRKRKRESEEREDKGHTHDNLSLHKEEIGYKADEPKKKNKKA